MTVFESRRTVPHRATEMFDLVADVENYPKFLPLCDGLSIRDTRAMSNGVTEIVADMTVSFKLFRETFTSRVLLDSANHAILTRYVDGPFRQLENRWRFEDAEPQDETPACSVDFFISYELKSRSLQLLARAVFDRAFGHFAQSFEQRADEVYGRPHPRRGGLLASTG